MDDDLGILMSNNFIRMLSRQGVFSENALKSLFRILSKKTHPDLNKGIDPGLFRKLEREYREACALLPKASQLLKNGSVDPAMIRYYLYGALSYYSTSGQHSFKVRNKPELAERNQVICSDVQRWAKLYDPDFLEIFNRYNSFRFQDFRISWNGGAAAGSGSFGDISSPGFPMRVMLFTASSLIPKD